MFPNSPNWSYFLTPDDKSCPLKGVLEIVSASVRKGGLGPLRSVDQEGIRRGVFVIVPQTPPRTNDGSVFSYV